jgi:hypothetical protein
VSMCFYVGRPSVVGCARRYGNDRRANFCQVDLAGEVVESIISSPLPAIIFALIPIPTS